jgi:hypothetical protein
MAKNSCPKCGRSWDSWAVATLLAIALVFVVAEAVGLFVVAGALGVTKAQLAVSEGETAKFNALVESEGKAWKATLQQQQAATAQWQAKYDGCLIH